jgi:hypothetical protein
MKTLRSWGIALPFWTLPKWGKEWASYPGPSTPGERAPIPIDWRLGGPKRRSRYCGVKWKLSGPCQKRHKLKRPNMKYSRKKIILFCNKIPQDITLKLFKVIHIIKEGSALPFCYIESKNDCDVNSAFHRAIKCIWNWRSHINLYAKRRTIFCSYIVSFNRNHTPPIFISGVQFSVLWHHFHIYSYVNIIYDKAMAGVFNTNWTHSISVITQMGAV